MVAGEGPPSLQDSITAFVAGHSGCSLNDICKAVGGKKDFVGTTIHQLLDEGALVNDGNSNGYRLCLSSSLCSSA